MLRLPTPSLAWADQLLPSSAMPMASGRMRRARAQSFDLGGIRRSDFAILINPRDGANVLGMNFLSSLNGWRVEGNYLVLQP